MREVSLVICNHETQTDRLIRVASEGLETVTLWARYGDHDLAVMPDAHGFRLTFRPRRLRIADREGVAGMKFVFDSDGVEIYVDQGRLEAQQRKGKVYLKAVDRDPQ